MNKVHLSEEQILSAIGRVLSENRTVLKLNHNEPAPSMGMQGDMMQPQAQPPMAPMGADPMMGGDPAAMGEDPNAMGADPMMGGEDPNAMGDQFDTNFDAGVEADEDSDPKHYIQQLTGKLSQKLNSYLGEDSDVETAKYVGKMIVKAVAKFLDEDDKKDLIKTINTTEAETEDDGSEEMPDDMGGDENMGAEADAMPQDDAMPMQQQPVQEMMFRKRDIKRLMEQVNDFKEDDVDNTRMSYTNKTAKKGPFSAKQFIKK